MYVQLRALSDYSVMDSVIKIPELAQAAASYGAKALALTDRHCLGGAVEFALCCQKYGIRPIFGLTVDVCLPKEEIVVLTLLAKDNQGFGQLLQLASQTGPLHLDDLPTMGRGIVALVGVYGDSLYRAAERNDGITTRSIFGQIIAALDLPDVYLNLDVNPGGAPGDEALQFLVKTLPQAQLVGSQTLLFLERDDRDAYRALQAIKQGRTFSEITANHLTPYLPPAQLEQALEPYPDAVRNTEFIAQECQVVLDFSPKMPKPRNHQDFHRQVWDGAKQRYGRLSSTVTDRIRYELDIIEKMHLADYFTIVADIISLAREREIPVGPGRGSAAASVVSYCLGITEVDPVKYNLVFERFLNQERSNLPDIDVDFCYQRRQEVLKLVYNTYGPDRVAHIGTYGTFGWRLALREACRVLEVPADVRDQLLSLFPEAEQVEANLAQLRKQAPQLAKVVGGLLGVKRHFSTHAAGLVISPEPITNYCSIRAPEENIPVTQMPMDSVEALGLLKFDLLGLRTLTVIDHCQRLIQDQEPDFVIEEIPTEDVLTSQLLAAGRSLGVFQLESRMFQELLRDFQPKNLADLIALLALGRPGPITHIDDYVKRRDGRETSEYRHPLLKPILEETYGLIIYQEQVIQIAHRLGGLPLAQADLLRVAMSKKNKEMLDSLRPAFLAGCQRQGLTSQAARELFEDMARFAGYAFNKAHSAAYALITWRTAFLKANYPVQFFTALLNYAGSQEQIGIILRDCICSGITVHPPDVRYAGADFAPEGDGVRIGLAHLKHMSRAVAQEIIQERQKAPFVDFADFRQRLSLSSAALSSLVHAGALDGLVEREQAVQILGTNTGPTTLRALLEMEKEIIGTYLSAEPARFWQSIVNDLSGGEDNVIGDLVWYRGNRGLLAASSGYIDFQLVPSALAFGSQLVPGASVALLGRHDGRLFQVEWVIPLRPLVLIRPSLAKVEALQRMLGHSGGHHPVVLKLGTDMYQLLPPQFWLSVNEDYLDKLREYGTVKVIDPLARRGGLDRPGSLL